jgi:dTDP-4-dehydrorhamnose 3,5-epimerase
VTYLCSTPYAPSREREIFALDPKIGIAWPSHDPDGRALTPSLSEKDTAAPTLADAAAAGILPNYDEVLAFRRSLT